MRVLSASVVLSSMVLGGWLIGAKAQNVDLDNPPALNQPSDVPADETGTLPGQVPLPSLDFPGIAAGVTLGEVYTDNLRVAGPAGSKQAGWITQIRPFVRGAMNRPRFAGVFRYALNGYLYEQPAGHHQLSHDLSARGKLTVLPQHFFIDGTVRYGQQIINNQLPGGGGTFFLDNNRANVGAATLSPYWVQDLGGAGTMMVRYTRGRVVYNHQGISSENSTLLNGSPNVTFDAMQFGLKSRRYETWGWDLGYSEERLDPDSGGRLDFAVANVEGSYRVNDRLRLLAGGGKETRFRPDGSVDKLGSPFWQAGLQWTTSRDSLRLMVGHRFFGRSYELSWTHQAALLTTNVSYTERPTTYNRQLLGMNFGLDSEGGLPPIAIRPDIPSLTERQPYLSKRLSAQATYLMPKSQLQFRVYDESRTFFVENEREERVRGARLAWDFQLGPFTTLVPSYRWQHYRFRDGQTNNRRIAELALMHRLNDKNFGSVRLRHDRTGVTAASQGAHGYTVNVLFVQWTHLF
jgi:hypothetical protein